MSAEGGRPGAICALDGHEYGTRLVWSLRGDVVGHGGLHRDQAHAVADDVVQLPGDPQPLGGHRIAREPAGGLGLDRPAPPDHPAGGPGPGHRHSDHAELDLPPQRHLAIGRLRVVAAGRG